MLSIQSESVGGSQIAYSSQPQQYYQFTGLQQVISPTDTSAYSNNLTNPYQTIGKNSSWPRTSVAGSRIIDYLIFSVTGGASSATIGVNVSLDGKVTGAGQNAVNYSSDLSFALGGGAFNYYGAINNNGTTTHGFNGPSGYSPISGWNSYTDAGSTTGFDWTSLLNVVNGSTIYGISAQIALLGRRAADRSRPRN